MVFKQKKTNRLEKKQNIHVYSDKRTTAIFESTVIHLFQTQHACTIRSNGLLYSPYLASIS